MFNQSGNMFTLAKSFQNIVPTLPGGTFEVKFSDEIGFFLVRRDDIQVTGKVYGNSRDRAEKIFKTFQRRSKNNKNTGVLLSGDKGSGKTFVWKMTAEMCIAAEIPVILISSAYAGGAFLSFMASIKQPVAVMFDEFEKVYKEVDAQESLLPLFDGVGHDNKLFMFTVNGMNVSEFLLNRPSRVFYHYKYSKIDVSFVREYCKDMGVSDLVLEKMEAAWALSSTFSFDILQSLVEEILANPDSDPVDAIMDMNFDPVVGRSYYEVKVVANGKLMMTENTARNSISNYVKGEFHLEKSMKLAELIENCSKDIYDLVKQDARGDKINLGTDYQGLEVTVRGLEPAEQNKTFTEFRYEFEETYAYENDDDTVKNIPVKFEIFVKKNSYEEPKLIDMLR